MKFMIALACLLAAMAPALGKLIVGGKESTAHSRPYQVALYDRSYKPNAFQFCGGTLVHKRWVVSAGHCVSGSVYVGLGYHKKYDHDLSGQQFIQGTWIRHPNYNSQTIDFDIALIHLSSDADVGSANIDAIGITSSQPAAGKKLLVSGWGTESSGAWSTPEELREVEVDAISTSACRSAYGSSGITDNMFCAGSPGKDACQGDSGGPIVSGHSASSHSPSTTLEGIVSWGYGCADPSYPGVYSNIAQFCDWISSTTGGEVKC